MSMRAMSVGLLVSLALVACSGSDPPPSPPTANPVSASTSSDGASSSPTPEPSLPSPSGDGFCTDRPIIDHVVALVAAGDEPYRRAAAFVTAAGKVFRGDAGSAASDASAFKMRQLALVLNTLRLAILGAADNYPSDFSVLQFTSSLPGRVTQISNEIGCPA
jgi:hypothetical protein